MCSKMFTKKTLFSFGFTSQKSESDKECSHSIHNHDVATSSERESEVTFSAEEDDIEVVQEIATVCEDKDDETAATVVQDTTT